MILGASKGILFSHYHLLQLCNFISHLSVHIHHSACADTKQAQNNTKIINFIHLFKVSNLPTWWLQSSCQCSTSYPQKLSLFWNCMRKKRSLTVQTKGAHYKENKGVHFLHGSKKMRITVLQLRQLVIGSVGRGKRCKSKPESWRYEMPGKRQTVGPDSSVLQSGIFMSIVVPPPLQLFKELCEEEKQIRRVNIIWSCLKRGNEIAS